jgi:hypothetical protein
MIDGRSVRLGERERLAMPPPPMPKMPTWKPAWSPVTGTLAPWPPASYRREYRVRAGESWQSVASGFLIPDVWDLIYFNFLTENPREVNWYMWRYLGCQRAASDGLNFSFAEASPGVLYIPPFGWKRSHDLLPFQTRIADEINRCGPHFPEVWYNGTHISRVDMYAISQLIREHRITVVHDFTIPDQAQYDTDSNTLIVHTPVFGALWFQSLLVHEVTHAILDMKKQKHLYRWENEMIAFATQAQFGYSADIYWAIDQARRLPALYAAAFVFGWYTNSNGKRVKTLLEHDREEESFLEPGKTINPFRELKSELKQFYGGGFYYIDGIW